MRRAIFAAVLLCLCGLLAIAETLNREMTVALPPEPVATDGAAQAAAPSTDASAEPVLVAPPPGAVPSPVAVPETGQSDVSAPESARAGSTVGDPPEILATPTAASGPAPPAPAPPDPAPPPANEIEGTATTASAPVELSPKEDREPAPKPSLLPARTIFGAAALPADLPAKAIGFYSRGCLAGGVALPIDGEVWQAMRLSRNRNWGHPRLIALVERLAEEAAAKDGWPGLLVGDLSQPRGGPMLTGHASHQVGLDADIWLTPMPDKRLSYAERESISATSMLGKDGLHVDPEVFTPHHAALIRRAASYPGVERIFVHPGIKKAMCQEAGVDRQHFHKIRPYWGHYYHMHVRIACPKDSIGCRDQPTTGNDDGCGKEVDDWLALLKRPAKPQPPATAAKPTPSRRQILLDDLPAECAQVAKAGNATVDRAMAERDQGSRSVGSTR